MQKDEADPSATTAGARSLLNSGVTFDISENISLIPVFRGLSKVESYLEVWAIFWQSKMTGKAKDWCMT